MNQPCVRSLRRTNACGIHRQLAALHRKLQPFFFFFLKNSRLLGMVCFLLKRPLRSLPKGGWAELLCLFSHIKEQREGVQPLCNPQQCEIQTHNKLCCDTTVPSVGQEGMKNERKMKHLFQELVRKTSDSWGSKRWNQYTCSQCVTFWKHEWSLQTASFSLDRALDVKSSGP